VRVRTRSTWCCGAASSKSPPACRASFRPRQRGHTTGIDKLQPGQIDDNLRGAGCDDRERSRNTYGVYDVKIPAQHDDNVTVALTGTQIHAEHSVAFLLQQQGGVPT
jgi:hypothetical protein